MYSNLVIDIDIQDDSKRAQNMMNQIQEIVNEYREHSLDRVLFDSIVKKIEHKIQYFTDYNFPPMFVLITMYGVALVDKKQKQVKLAEHIIMSPNYRVTEEQIKRGSIL